MRRSPALVACALAFAAHAQPVDVTIPGPVIAVPPPTIETVHPPPPAPAPAPVTIPRPSTLTTCDPGGCWDSQGRRLDRSGPLLLGPHGACQVQGGVVQCPS